MGGVELRPHPLVSSDEESVMGLGSVCVCWRACLQKLPRWCFVDRRGSARASTALPLPASQLLSTAVLAALTPPLHPFPHPALPYAPFLSAVRSAYTHTHTQPFIPPHPRRHRRRPRWIRVCGSGLDSASQKRLPDPPLLNLKPERASGPCVCAAGRRTLHTETGWDMWLRSNW